MHGMVKNQLNYFRNIILKYRVIWKQTDVVSVISFFVQTMIFNREGVCQARYFWQTGGRVWKIAISLQLMDHF